MNANMNMMNSFVKANVMGVGSSYTENGAVSYGTMGKAILDQFGKAGTARGRDYDVVWEEQARLWSEDAETALRFPFYLRMITRKDNIIGGGKTDEVQRGQGARDEAFKRLLWVAAYHSDEFYRNIWILPVVGSWKDLWTIMFMAQNDDMPVEFSLSKENFFRIIADGIQDDNHRDLVKKYMPRIRSEKKCTTPWAKVSNKLAKEFAEFAGWTYEDYREFKSTGRAHEFQRIICSRDYDGINWNTIPGKALLNLVSGDFLDKHRLTESYIEWLKSQPVVKFNGYAFELLQKISVNGHVKSNLATSITVDKQFDNLIKTAKDGNNGITGNVLCALDTSGSMTVQINGAPNGLSSYDVCVSLGIYFSELNTGAFHNVVAMFDDNSYLKTLSGSFTDKARQIQNESTAWGGTNFQSLIDLIVDTRLKNPGMPLEEFPKTLLVVSDMQFNPSGMYSYNRYGGVSEASNYEASIAKLKTVFPEEFVNEFKFVWWYCAGRPTTDFPSNMEHGGSYMFSGFDPSVITFLLGGDDKVDENGNVESPSMEEIIQKALSQEALLLIQ